ncbi:hypothetical protein Aperf_G00000028015 [Anoplocephala perfoliata]
MCVLSRIMILSEKSISSAVELYNALWAVRDQVPNVGLPVDYLSHLPQKMTFEPLIPLNKACTAFLKLAPEIDPLENNGTASSNGKYGAVVVPAHKKNSAQSNLFSEMGALPKVTSKPRSNSKSSGKVTPVVVNLPHFALITLFRIIKGKPIIKRKGKNCFPFSGVLRTDRQNRAL